MTGEGERRAYLTPTPLRAEHVLDRFRCSSDEQMAWLIRHARSSDAGGFTKVFVVTERNSPDVVGYYAWTMCAVRPADAPPRFSRGGGLHEVPLALLARLAVDSRHERAGVGSGLLRDVLTRAAAVGDVIGCRGLLVHCETPGARDFYTSHVPDFVESPTDPMHLALLMKTLRALGGPTSALRENP